ncbi:MAG: thiamine pyrophosphate-dependent enzyme, partial [Candidatus Omnitrophica bacterium]|nr:thiamine pyrophosphate-dependent enzyme [Candidatus Omnitrophota bacterium]
NYAREGNGPSFIVANTYRYYGHSRSDPRVYRTREEEKFWKERDPIIIFSNKMKEMGILTEQEINQIEEEVKKEIEEAVDYAIKSPYPEPEELYTDLYA